MDFKTILTVVSTIAIMVSIFIYVRKFMEIKENKDYWKNEKLRKAGFYKAVSILAIIEKYEDNKTFLIELNEHVWTVEIIGVNICPCVDYNKRTIRAIDKYKLLDLISGVLYTDGFIEGD